MLRPKSHLLMLALIIVLAALLRLYNLSGLGFWCDELCSLSEANGHGLHMTFVPLNCVVPAAAPDTKLSAADSFWHIPATLAQEGAHPPLYFMMLRIWEEVWGDSEAAVRSLTVVFSLLAIALLYLAARDTIGSLTALVACALMAVATPQIQYAQEARDYMPVLPMGLAGYVAITRLARTGRRIWAVVLLLCVAGMLFTHYFAAGIATGLFVYAVLELRRRERVYALAAMAGGGMLFCIFWGPVVLHQRAVTLSGLLWLADDAPGHLLRRLIDLCQLPIRFFAEISSQSACFWSIGALMLCSVPILFAKRPELRPWLAWLACTLGLVAVLDVARSSSQLHWVRYALFATPAAYVLMAAAIRGRWRLVLPGVALLSSVWCLPAAYQPSWKIDFREMVMTYQRHKGSGDGLVICGDYPEIEGIMLEAFRRYSAPLPPVTGVLTAPPQGATLEELKRSPHVWIAWLGNNRHMPGFTVDQQFEWPAQSLQEGNFSSPTSGPAADPR